MSGKNGISVIAVMLVTVIFIMVSCGGGTNDPIGRWEKRKAGLLKAAERKSANALIESLWSNDAGERVASYMTLVERDPEEVIPVWLETEPDSDEGNSIKLTYWKPLCAAWGKDAVPVLIEYFKPDYLSRDAHENFPDEYSNSWDAIEGFAAVGPDASEIGPVILGLLNEDLRAPALNSNLYDVLLNTEYSPEEALETVVEIINSGDTLYLPQSAFYYLGRFASGDDAEVTGVLKSFIYKTESNPRGVSWHKSLAARAALYMLGVDQDENFEVIEAKAWPEGRDYLAEHEARVALAMIGDTRSIEALANAVVNADDLGLTLAIGQLASCGPEPIVLESLTEIMSVNIGSLNGRLAAYYLGMIGEGAKPVLPDMVDYYKKLSESYYDPGKPEILTATEESIIRVHEGIPFPAFVG